MSGVEGEEPCERCKPRCESVCKCELRGIPDKQDCPNGTNLQSRDMVARVENEIVGQNAVESGCEIGFVHASAAGLAAYRARATNTLL